MADLRDHAILDAEIAAVAWDAGSIDDGSVLDDNIVLRHAAPLCPGDVSPWLYVSLKDGDHRYGPAGTDLTAAAGVV